MPFGRAYGATCEYRQKQNLPLSVPESLFRAGSAGVPPGSSSSRFRGNFPAAHRPLAVVQIDHTKLDLIVVDEVDRKPLARPWFTVAIDVFSRVVTGFFFRSKLPAQPRRTCVWPLGFCQRTICLPNGHPHALAGLGKNDGYSLR
jgi:transposase InsO family protein